MATRKNIRDPYCEYNRKFTHIHMQTTKVHETSENENFKYILIYQAKLSLNINIVDIKKLQHKFLI